MHWNAVPVAILAGITGYAALLFFGLYVSLAKVTDERSRREYLSFALTCVAVVAYDISCVGLYDARTLEQGFFWNRAQLFTAAWLGVAHQSFTWDFLKRPMPRLLKAAAVVLAVLGTIVCFWESPHTLTIAAPAIKHIRLFGREAIYYEVDAGALDQVQMVLFLFVYLVDLGYLFRFLRSRSGGAQPGRLAFLVATGVSGAAATNDFLIAAGVYTSLYAFECGIAAILMAMGYILLMRFGALHEVVNVLNQDLSKTNADLVVALEQARESDRSKTEFLAAISHELRTPLNAIINLPEGLLLDFQQTRLARCGACQMEYELEEAEEVKADTPCMECGAAQWSMSQRIEWHGDAESAETCLRTVSRASRHLLGLVNDVLDASKLELRRTLLNPTSVDLFELVSEVAASAQTVADKRNVTLRVQPVANGSHMAPIIADRLRIGQVLYNLIGNAIKFSPEGGVVEVSVSSPAVAERVICVRDHGIGIAPKNHGLIFEKFRQVDGSTTRSYGGTGLGLAISKGLVELHGGRIGVESEEGHGAAFFVRLPDAPQLSAAQSDTGAGAGA